MSIINIKINDAEVKKQIQDQIQILLKESETELVFWNSNELMRRTGFSWNFIQEQFFFDPRFVKRKVGRNWIFPAKKTRDFLEMWLLEQPKQ